MSGVTDKTRPADRALDLFFYAPIGFVLEASELIPKLVERGRSQVSGQVSMARVVGKFAVQTGRAEASKRIGAVQESATSALSELGLWPSPDGTEPVPRAPSTEVQPPPEPAEVVDAPAVETLAIPDYDGLAASQVVPRLEGLQSDELEAVRRYELAHRGRKTVLGKIAQLQSA